MALGFSNGFFLHGTGGIAKSYTVLNELQRLGVDFKLFNSRMSGRGLFEALAEYPKASTSLEDMERVVKDKDAQGILRSPVGASGATMGGRRGSLPGRRQRAWNPPSSKAASSCSAIGPWTTCPN